MCHVVLPLSSTITARAVAWFSMGNSAVAIDLQTSRRLVALWVKDVSDYKAKRGNHQMNIRGALFMSFAILPCQSAFADEAGYMRKHQRLYIPASRHVIEVVTPPYSAQFVINGHRYDGIEPACRAWVPAQPVKFISGSWYGDCVNATFYNAALRSTCQTVCRGRAWWWN